MSICVNASIYLVQGAHIIFRWRWNSSLRYNTANEINVKRTSVWFSLSLSSTQVMSHLQNEHFSSGRWRGAAEILAMFFTGWRALGHWRTSSQILRGGAFCTRRVMVISTNCLTMNLHSETFWGDKRSQDCKTSQFHIGLYVNITGTLFYT